MWVVLLMCCSGSSSMSAGSTGGSPRRFLAYTAAFSRKHSLRQVYEFLVGRLKISRDDMRLWKLIDEVRSFSGRAKEACLYVLL